MGLFLSNQNRTKKRFSSFTTVCSCVSVISNNQKSALFSHGSSSFATVALKGQMEYEWKHQQIEKRLRKRKKNPYQKLNKTQQEKDKKQQKKKDVWCFLKMQSIWTHHCTLDIYTLQDLGSVGKSLGWVRFVQLGTHFCCRGKGAGMEKWEIYYIHWEMGNKKRFLLLLAYWPHIFYTEHTKKGGRLCNLKSAESALTQESVSLHAVGFTQWWQVSLALTGHGWLAQRVGYRATLKAGALLAGVCSLLMSKVLIWRWS